MKKQLNEQFIRMQKLAGIITENQINEAEKMRIFALKNKQGRLTELFKIKNFSNVNELLYRLDQYLGVEGLHTEENGTGYNYAQVSDDGQVYLVKSLSEFAKGYRTEKEWRVASEEEVK
jgi:hypothetical protein